MTDIQKQLAEASVECVTDESGTDYSVSIRIPGMTRALQSDVWIKGGRKADLLVKWLNDEVIPALAAHRQQEARGPLTDQEADLLTAPFLLRVLGSSSVFVEQARQLVRAIEAAHRIRGE